MRNFIINILCVGLISGFSMNLFANDEGQARSSAGNYENRRQALTEHFQSLSEEERQAAIERFQNSDAAARRARIEDSNIAERIRDMTPEEREIALERLRNFRESQGEQLL